VFWLDLHLASRRNTGTDMSYTQDKEEKVARGIERRNTHILDILAVRSISYGRVIGPAAARSARISEHARHGSHPSLPRAVVRRWCAQVS
jgi:hypothetical protein